MDQHRNRPGPEAADAPMLGRRVGAGLVDLAAVAIITAGWVTVTATRLPAIRRPDGSVTFHAADQETIIEMTGPLSRGHLIGDTLWAFSTLDVVLVAFGAALSGLLVGVAVPWLTRGRSPGKTLFGLRIVAADGRPVGWLQHLVRTFVAPADLMPLVVPGLTGFAFAASNPGHQRIGDRLARTFVVEHGPTIRSLIGSWHISRHASLNAGAKPPDHLGDGDTVHMTDSGTSAGRSTPPSAEVTSARVPVEERSGNPYPKPVRRQSDEPDRSGQSRFDALMLPESSLSDMPLTNAALMEALGLPAELPDHSSVEPETAAEADEPIAGTSPTSVTGTESADERHERRVQPANKRAPIWSEDWDAWIYWDTVQRGWFRYDEASRTWLPMDDD